MNGAPPPDGDSSYARVGVHFVWNNDTKTHTTSFQPNKLVWIIASAELKKLGDGTETPMAETERPTTFTSGEVQYLGIAQEKPVMPGVVAVCVNGHAVLEVEDSKLYTPGCVLYASEATWEILPPNDTTTHKVKVGIVVPPTFSNKRYLSILIAH
jgi:hypothetical protein